MLSRQRDAGGDSEDREPLLQDSAPNGSADDSFVFDADDLDDPPTHAAPPPLALKSTIAGREAEYELDPDELDEAHGGQRPLETPLLVGLIDTSHVRRGSDGALIMGNVRQDDSLGDIDLEDLAQRRQAGGSLLDAAANMANSILGAGIIGLPYAMKQAGFFTGIFLLVTLTVVTDWTIRLIVINAKLSGRNSYIAIMDHCFGRPGRAAVSLFQFAFAFGGMCAFGIIIGDTIPHVVRSIFPSLETSHIFKFLINRQFIIAVCTICVSYPLSLYRDIHKLSRASGLALLGMLIIVISVFIEREKVTPDLKGDPSQRFILIQPQIAQAIGVISFAFVCHHNSLLIYGSLRTPTLDRFAFVTHISIAVSLASCLTLAVSAYVVFTNKTQGNVLNNFAPDDTVINVARFCFGLNMFTTLPLELFVCREVIEQYFFSHEAFNMQRHMLFTTAILFSSMILSMMTCDLGVMLEITGGVSATALAFIFPAICYIKLTPKDVKLFSKQKLPALVCAIFGLCILVLSLFFALTKVWSSEGSAKICL